MWALLTHPTILWFDSSAYKHEWKREVEEIDEYFDKPDAWGARLLRAMKMRLGIKAR